MRTTLWWNGIEKLWREILGIHIYWYERGYNSTDILKIEDSVHEYIQKSTSYPPPVTCFELYDFALTNELPYSSQYKIKDDIDIYKSRKLDFLYLNDLKAPDIEPLVELDQIEHIEARFNKFKNFNSISKIGNIKILNIRHNEIESISNIKNLSKLQSLNIESNKLTEVTEIGFCKSLKELNIGGNLITEICPTFELPKLEYLSIWGNKLSDISFVANLKSLKTLNISISNVVDIDALCDIGSLENLSIVHNKLKDPSQISNLKNLKKLLYSPKTIEESTIRLLKKLMTQCEFIESNSGIDRRINT